MKQVVATALVLLLTLFLLPLLLLPKALLPLLKKHLSM